MIKKFIALFLLILTYSTLVMLPVIATDIPPNDPCDLARIKTGTDRCVDSAGNPGTGYACLPFPPDPSKNICRKATPTDIVGKVIPPSPIQALGAGGTGISTFLSNIVTLIYIIASVVFVFMILWGALQWISSGGDKEQLDNAKKRITQAIIGIILFAVAFAILRAFDTFTGFTFFIPKGVEGCEDKYYYDATVNQCIHKYAGSGPCPPYVFDRVDDRFCGK